MNKPQTNNPVLKQAPLTEQEIDRLENYPKAKRVDLAALIAKRKQTEPAQKPST